MKFQREAFIDVADEAVPLLHEHYREIAHYPDIKLDPDAERYILVEESGRLRVYTARSDQGALVGYAVFIVMNNLHYKNSIQATQDVLFISKAKRGEGFKFVKWCDEQLRAEKIQVVYHHVKKNHNFGPALERIGYELVDLIYARRLDQ